MTLTDRSVGFTAFLNHADPTFTSRCSALFLWCLRQSRLNSLHDAHHRAMECLGRMIFESQRSGRMPDGESYIACVQRNATQD
jgi:hypothetical protein